MNRFEENCVVERFRQELDRPITNRLGPHLGVTVSCDENDRYAAAVRLEP